MEPQMVVDPINGSIYNSTVWNHIWGRLHGNAYQDDDGARRWQGLFRTRTQCGLCSRGPWRYPDDKSGSAASSASGGDGTTPRTGCLKAYGNEKPQPG